MNIMLAGLLLIIAIILYAESTIVSYEARDATSEEGSTGEDVVEACISSMEEKLSVTSQDYLLLRRIALVESNFGQNQQIMQATPSGGIWQVSNEIFQTLKENDEDSRIKTLREEIDEKYGFDCFACNIDFNSPIRSALAARLFIHFKLGEEIPTSLTEQAEWWALEYQNGGNTSDVFESIVKDFEGDYKMEQKCDMWFMLDGSATVTEPEFTSCKGFTSSVVSQCTVAPAETRCGLSVYSETNEVSYTFEETTDFEEFEIALNTTEKPDPPLRCGNAFEEIVDDGFGETYDTRWSSNDSFSKCIFLICDQGSTDSYQESITHMKDENVNLFTVGIGNELEQNKIKEMSEPFGNQYSCSQSSYDDLADENTKDNIFYQFCNATTYSEEDIDLICVVICDYFVDQLKSSGEDTAELERQVKEELYLDCPSCRNYSAAESTSIMALLENSENENLKKRIEKIRTPNVTTTDAPDTSQTSETLCGNGFKSDVWFLVDASPGTDVEDIKKVETFYDDMISRFNISSDKVQLGMSKFSEEHVILEDLKQPTDPIKLTEHLETITPYPKVVNIGQCMKDVLNSGFNLSNPTRDETDVQKLLIVVITDDSTDNLTEAAQLVKDSNITVFAVGVGDKVNSSTLETVASEPKEKHVFKMSGFDNLDISLATNILKTVSDTPAKVEKGQPLNVEVKKDVRREISTTANRYDGLDINITSSETDVNIDAYVKIGKTLVNSANYDAKFTLNDGSGNVFIKIDEILKNYPEINASTVDLSIAVIADKKTNLKIDFGIGEVQQTLDKMNSLITECKSETNKTSCINEIEVELNESKPVLPEIDYDDLVVKLDDLKKTQTTDDLDKLITECQNTANKTYCIVTVEVKLNQSKPILTADEYDEFLVKLIDLKKEQIVEDAEDKTEECKTAVNQFLCYEELEKILLEASKLNITINVSQNALDEFKEKNPSLTTAIGTTGEIDFQTFDFNFLWLLLLLLLFSGTCIIAYKKKKKEKVEPEEEEEKLSVSEIHKKTPSQEVIKSFSDIDELSKDKVDIEKNSFLESNKLSPVKEERLSAENDDLQVNLESATKASSIEISQDNLMYSVIKKEVEKEEKPLSKDHEAETKAEVPLINIDKISNSDVKEKDAEKNEIKEELPVDNKDEEKTVNEESKKALSEVRLSSIENESLNEDLVETTPEHTEQAIKEESVENEIEKEETHEEEVEIHHDSEEDFDEMEDEYDELEEYDEEEIDDDYDDDDDDEIDDEEEEEELDEEDSDEEVQPGKQASEEKLVEKKLIGIEKKLKRLTEEAQQPYATSENVVKLKKQIEKAETAGVSPTEIESSKDVLKNLEEKIEQEMIENIQDLFSKVEEPGAPIEYIQELREQLQIVNALGINDDQFSKSKNRVEEFDNKMEEASKKLDAIERILTAEGEPTTESKAKFFQSLEELKNEINSEVDEKIAVHSSLVQKLKKTNKDSKKALVNKTILNQMQTQLTMAETLEVPEDKVEDFQETAKDMEEDYSTLESAKGLLQEALDTEDSNLLEKALVQTKNLKLKTSKKGKFTDEDLQKMRKAAFQLKRKNTKVGPTSNEQKVKKKRKPPLTEMLTQELQDASDSGEPKRIKKALYNAKNKKGGFTNSPADVKLKGLIKKVEKRNKQLKQLANHAKDADKKKTEEKHQSDELSSKPAKVELEVDDSEDIPKLDKINKAIEKTLKNVDVNNLDIDGLIAEIENKFGKLSTEELQTVRFSIDRFKLILELKRSIGYRSDSMLKNVLEMKDAALETTLKGYDIEGDKEMSDLINRANELRLLFEKIEKMKAVVMSLKQPTISEVRSYSNPPKAIRNVMEATYILLGEKRKTLKSWQSLKALIGKSGQHALKRRIWERDLEEIEYNSAKYAGSLLEGFAVEDVEVISSAGSVFYSWSTTVIQQVMKQAEEHAAA